MDNAKKLIPESYKVDGNEFEMTDGNETYRVKWSSLINEGIVLTSSNKGQINEDMGKMKHLMGFKSQETLGTVKGADRLDENKKFGDVLDKTKKLINESAITEIEEEVKNHAITNVIKDIHPGDEYFLVAYFKDTNSLKFLGWNDMNEMNDWIEINLGHPSTNSYKKRGNTILYRGQFLEDAEEEFNKYKHLTKDINLNESAITEVEEEIDESIEEGEHIKSGMGGSNKGKSRTDKTEVLKKDSKKKRRKADKEATKDINENDVEAFQSALGDSPKVAAAAKKVNTRDEKFEAAIAYINNMVGDNDVLKSKIARTLLKKDDVSELENPELADLNKDGELSSYEKKRGSAIEKAMNEFDGDEDEYEYYRRGGRELDDYLDDAEKEARRAKESGIFKDDLPPGPSDEEEQAAQVYEDRFDEVFEGMYEEDEEVNNDHTYGYGTSSPVMFDFCEANYKADEAEIIEYDYPSGKGKRKLTFFYTSYDMDGVTELGKKTAEVIYSFQENGEYATDGQEIVSIVLIDDKNQRINFDPTITDKTYYKHNGEVVKFGACFNTIFKADEASL